MIPIVIFAVSLIFCPTQPSHCSELQRLYAGMDRVGMQDLLQRSTTQEERFLVLYRLYPIASEGGHLLSELPDDLGTSASARELALLAALWSYRHNTEGLFGKMNAARRAMRLIERARSVDPNDPYVLLVEGQFLLYKPRVVGGSASLARERFEALVSRLRTRSDCALTLTEAQSWLWMSMHRMKDPAAESTRQELLAANPPPIFRAFLENKP